MYSLKVAIFDENMVVGKSKYLVILYLYELTQPSDPLILGGPLILLPPIASTANTAIPNSWNRKTLWAYSGVYTESAGAAFRKRGRVKEEKNFRDITTSNSASEKSRQMSE